MPVQERKGQKGQALGQSGLCLQVGTDSLKNKSPLATPQNPKLLGPLQFHST